MINSRNILIGVTFTTKWHKKYVDILKDKCIDILKNNYNVTIMEYPVSGSYELIHGCLYLSQNKCDAIIAIGILLKSETDHYKYTSLAVTKGLVDIQIKYEIPIINGILNVKTEQQMIDRTEKKCTANDWAKIAIDLSYKKLN
jgi:6,7-dimethyl-8-ribityllumazine synthase